MFRIVSAYLSLYKIWPQKNKGCIWNTSKWKEKAENKYLWRSDWFKHHCQIEHLTTDSGGPGLILVWSVIISPDLLHFVTNPCCDLRGLKGGRNVTVRPVWFIIISPIPLQLYGSPWSIKFKINGTHCQYKAYVVIKTDVLHIPAIFCDTFPRSCLR